MLEKSLLFSEIFANAYQQRRGMVASGVHAMPLDLRENNINSTGWEEDLSTRWALK